MKIGIIGTGYVGLPTGVGLAELGNEVICIDKNIDKITALNRGEITLFEEGLEELLIKNHHNGRLKFTSSMQEGIKDADIVIIAVGTPPHAITKEADMQYIHAAAKELALYLQDYTVVATKSTVPIGTGDEVEKIIKTQNPNADFDVVSLPEFLREGFAVHDFFNPDRIIVGSNSQKATEIIAKLYQPFAEKTPILYVKRRSSETIKYASNAFLAIKIHYINEMADFCEKADADIFEVAQGMGLDSRIGNKFLNPGPGYGGSCFPKDTDAMLHMGNKYNSDFNLIYAAVTFNQNRKKMMAKRILDKVSGIKNPKIAVLGLAFKGGTDDCRESPAVNIIEQLLEHNLNIVAYDPKAMLNAKSLLGDKISYAKNIAIAAKDADILVVLTEWNDFKNIDLSKIKSLMKTPKIVDLRNIINKDKALELGFDYIGIGR